MRNDEKKKYGMKRPPNLMVMIGGVSEFDRSGDWRFVLLIAVVKFTVCVTHFFTNGRLGILHAGRENVEQTRLRHMKKYKIRTGCKMLLASPICRYPGGSWNTTHQQISGVQVKGGVGAGENDVTCGMRIATHPSRENKIYRGCWGCRLDAQVGVVEIRWQLRQSYNALSQGNTRKHF
jgi:hypothetical protein